MLSSYASTIVAPSASMEYALDLSHSASTKNPCCFILMSIDEQSFRSSVTDIIVSFHIHNKLS